MVVSMSPCACAGSSATPGSYDVAMLGKIREQQQLEGESAKALIDAAAPPSVPPPGTGTLVDDVA